ncbi:hypothetical protein, partial [Bacillus sp. OTU2372]|uniref:hypothetical protein n=1 Tax=Bacillus sp. OTU2372 TaxID=3043858 RepID=UPI00313D855B
VCLVFKEQFFISLKATFIIYHPQSAKSTTFFKSYFSLSAATNNNITNNLRVRQLLFAKKFEVVKSI